MNGIYQPGDVVLDGWCLQRQIGAGSFGKVFEAVHEDSSFGKSYRSAIKIITISPNQADLDTDEPAAEEDSLRAYSRSIADQMLHEIDLMYRLKGDSNIVSYEGHTIVPHDDGIGWDIILRMELLTPLRQYMKEHSLTHRDVINLGMDICKALELCQKYNIIHRDIKPENIFVSQQGNFKLGDFGIARTMESTAANMSKKGTYNYMAPEIYLGKSYGPSVDIYSLGIVLYRLLNNNRVPFLPPYPQQITLEQQEDALIRRMRGEPLPAPVNARGRLTEIVMKACAWDPADRYSAPWLLRADLQKILYPQSDAKLVYPNGDQVPNPSVSSEEVSYQDISEKPVRKKNRLLLWLIPVVILLIAALAIGGVVAVRSGMENARYEKYSHYLQEASECSLTDHMDALDYLQKAMDLLPEEPEAYQQYAYVLYQNGAYEDCVRFVDDAGISTTTMTLIAASADFELGEYASAAERYCTTVDTDPDEMEIENLRDYAVCLGRLGRLDEAATIFVMLTDRGATADVTSYVLGETYYAKGKYADAAECFKTVLTATNDPVLLRRCYISLAETYRDMPDPDALVQAAQQGLSALPGNTVLLEMLGSAYHQIGLRDQSPEDHLRAADAFQQVIDAGIVKSYLYVNVITTAVAAEDYERALACADEMVETFSRDYTGHALRATVLILMENELPESERDYQQAYQAYQTATSMVTSQDDRTYLLQLEGLIEQLAEGGWLN